MPAASTTESVKAELDNLMKKKDITEQLIAVYREQAVFDEKLILPDGFPRNDLDLVAIRTARNKHACLQNDHKALMKEIEQKLMQFHETKLKLNSTPKFSQVKEAPTTAPFASVDHVKVYVKVFGIPLIQVLFFKFFILLELFFDPNPSEL